MADNKEKDAWLHIVDPNDLDLHMANIGQAPANANIVKTFFSEYPLKAGSSLLIPGCGTCQMFDYINPLDIGNVKITFTDINLKMLAKAKNRLQKYDISKYSFIKDDIENTVISGKYDAVLLSLVLLHIDWKKSIKNILAFSPSAIYIIEQSQKSFVSPVTKKRDLPKSIREYAKITNSGLINLPELINFLNKEGFRLIREINCEVPDMKVMHGFVFLKK